MFIRLFEVWSRWQRAKPRISDVPLPSKPFCFLVMNPKPSQNMQTIQQMLETAQNTLSFLIPVQMRSIKWLSQ